MQNCNKFFLIAFFLGIILTTGCINTGVDQSLDPDIPITTPASTQPGAVITTSPPSFTITRQMLTMTNGSYTINATFPRVSGELPVYSLQKPNFTKAWVKTLAEDLGMSPDIIESDNGFSVNSSDIGKYYFYIRKDTGEISFQNFSGRSGQPQPPTQAISDANNFLNKHGIMPADAYEPVVNYNGGQSISPSGKPQIDWQTSVINYKRKINGLPVYGAAAKLEVELDSNGNIIGIHKNWPEYQINKTSIAKSPEMAFFDSENYINTHGLYWNAFPFWPEKIVIHQIGFVYVQGIRNESGYLKPAYVFWGDGIQGDKSDRFSSAIIVSAIDGDPECRI